MKTFDHIDYDSFTSMYQDVLYNLLDDPEFKIAPRGLPISEMVNVTLHVMPEDCKINFAATKAPERQEPYDRYSKAEMEWYLSGNTLASSAPSKFWGQLADANGHITSNYGHMMLFDKIYPTAAPGLKDEFDDNIPIKDMPLTPFECEFQTPFERLIETLTKDKDSRQAIVHYNQPRHCYPQNKDFPCTVYSQFFIRNDELMMTTYQRSCDVIKGLSYDVQWNCHFMEMVFKKLKETYPDLRLGELTHVFGSLHLYAKDDELAQRISEKA